MSLTKWTYKPLNHVVSMTVKLLKCLFGLVILKEKLIVYLVLGFLVLIILIHSEIENILKGIWLNCFLSSILMTWLGMIKNIVIWKGYGTIYISCFKDKHHNSNKITLLDLCAFLCEYIMMKYYDNIMMKILFIVKIFS